MTLRTLGTRLLLVGGSGRAGGFGVPHLGPDFPGEGPRRRLLPGTELRRRAAGLLRQSSPRLL
jgi:hypothetical protein